MAISDDVRDLELLRFEIQKDLKDHEHDLVQKLEIWKATWQKDFEQWRLEAEFTYKQHAIMSQAIISFAEISIKGLLIVNGGAAIALLAFLGQIWGADSGTAQLAAVKAGPSLAAFVAGTAFSVVTGGASYLAQAFYVELPERTLGNSFRYIAVACAALGIISFGIGSWLAIETFTIGQPT